MKKGILLIIIMILATLLLYTGVQTINNSDEQVDSNIQRQEENIEEKTEEIETKTVKILSAGDMIFHMPQIKAAYTEDGNYNFDDNFEYVKGYATDADIAIVSYETATSEANKNFSGFPKFHSPEETLSAVKNAGFDIITTANNHSLDKGKAGLINNLNLAEKYGLKTVGTYKEPQREYLIKEENGIKIGFLAYTYGLNGLDSYLTREELSYMVNLIDEEKIEKDIKKLKYDVDVVVVSMHWGEEYQRISNDFQRDLGHKMVDWGANIILGSHTHVIQESEIVKKDGRDNFIVYSMGNFLSNQRQETMGNSYSEDGTMIEIVVEKNMEDNETIIKEVEFIPTWVYKYNENGKDSYRIIPTKDAIDGKLGIKFSDIVMDRINKSYNDSMNTLNYRNQIKVRD